MKKLLILLLLASILLSGCDFSITLSKDGSMQSGTYTGTGAITTKDYDLSDFNALHVANDIQMLVSQGDTFSVSVTTNEDVFDKLSISLVGKTLKVGDKENIILKDTIVTMQVTMPEITGITAENDASVSSDDMFATKEKVSVIASNDAKVNVNINAPSFTLNGSNDSKVILAGSTGEIKAILENEANIDLSALMGEIAHVSMENDAVASINVTGNIHLTTDNSPTLHLYGGTLVKETVSEDTIIKEH